MLPIEFNSHKFGFMQFVIVEICGLFSWPKNPRMKQNNQKWPQKEKICKNFQFFEFCQFFALIRMLKRFNKTRTRCSVVVHEINAVLRTKRTQKWQKTKTFPIFKGSSLWIRILQTLNMVLVRCSVGFSEEIIAVFQMIKISNWHRKWQNSQNFPFSKFLRIFCQIVDRLRGLECFKASKGKVLVVQWWSFSKSLLRFSKWKCLKVTAKMTKIPKFPNFQRFHAFFHFYDGLRKLKTIMSIIRCENWRNYYLFTSEMYLSLPLVDV